MKIHKHIKKHVKKHHKKYLGAITSWIVAHILVVKIVAVKFLIMKVILLTITSLGIMEGVQHKAFADIENACINNNNIIGEGHCNKNYNSLQEAITSLEKEIHFTKSSIDDIDQVGIFQGILENYCNINTIQGAQATVDLFGLNFEKYINPFPLYKKLDYLDGFYDKLLSAGHRIYTNNTKSYCKQKYILYGLEGFIQSRYMGILEENGLAGSQLLWNNMDKNKNKILLPTLETQLRSVKKTLKSAPILENVKVKEISMHDFGNEETKILKNKIIEVTENSVKNVLANMIEKEIININDIKILKDKINVKYLWGCQATKGTYTINRNFEGTSLVDIQLKNISINVNLCPSYHYLNNLNEYVETIFTHEMGHHIYYFKDERPKNFERICRTNRKQNKCESDDYISNYASSIPEEDYAETFLHRYQKDFSQNITDTMNQKFSYFSKILF